MIFHILIATTIQESVLTHDCLILLVRMCCKLVVIFVKTWYRFFFVRAMVDIQRGCGTCLLIGCLLGLFGGHLLLSKSPYFLFGIVLFLSCPWRLLFRAPSPRLGKLVVIRFFFAYLNLPYVVIYGLLVSI